MTKPDELADEISCARSVMRSWCDDLFLHGHSLGHWICDYVDLEESLAVGSIAQDQLAHAAALFELCGVDEVSRDHQVFVRASSGWLPSRLAVWVDSETDWAACVVRSFLLTSATVTLLESLSLATDEASRALATVLSNEQRPNLRHWRRWIEVLGADSTTRGELSATLTEGMTRSRDLFGLPDCADSTRLGAPLGGYHLHSAWLRMLEPTLESLHIDVGDDGEKQPVPREPGGADLNALSAILDRMRSVRVEHPDRIYTEFRSP
jgi:1,2-phenylacetyl-CoA epoxidase catalytic subunit